MIHFLRFDSGKPERVRAQQERRIEALDASAEHDTRTFSDELSKLKDRVLKAEARADAAEKALAGFFIQMSDGTKRNALDVMREALCEREQRIAEAVAALRNTALPPYKRGGLALHILTAEPKEGT